MPGIEWWRCLDHIACQALGLVRLADVRDIDQAVLREDTLWLTILLPLQCLTFLAERACNCGAAWCGHETPAAGDVGDGNSKDADEKFEDVEADVDSAAADADVCEGHLARRLASRALNLLRGLVFVDSSVLHAPPPSRERRGIGNLPAPSHTTGAPAAWCCSLEQATRLVFVVGCLVAARRLFPDNAHLAPSLWQLALQFAMRAARRTRYIAQCTMSKAVAAAAASASASATSSLSSSSSSSASSPSAAVNVAAAVLSGRCVSSAQLALLPSALRPMAAAPVSTMNGARTGMCAGCECGCECGCEWVGVSEWV